jgi:hypothetical protein
MAVGKTVDQIIIFKQKGLKKKGQIWKEEVCGQMDNKKRESRC